MKSHIIIYALRETAFEKFPSGNIAEWSSPVARRAHNPKVVGSNPASATIWSGHFRCPLHFCQYSCGFAGFLGPKIQSDFP